MRNLIRPSIVLPVLIGVLYSIAAYAPFAYDDHIHIVENPLVRAFDSLFDAGAWTGLVRSEFGWSGRPLLFLTYGLNHAMSGLDASRFRMTNIVIHMINALLVFAIALRLGRYAGRREPEAKWLAWVAGAVFAAHPLAVESVAYVAGRSSSFCALFYFAGILAMMIAASRSSAAGIGLWGGLAVLSFAAALLVKQDAVMLPTVSCALALFALPAGVSFRRRFAVIGLAIVIGAGAFLLQQTSMESVRRTTLENEKLVAAGFARTLTPSTYTLTAVKEWTFYYLWRLFLPVNLSVDPAPRDIETPWTVSFLFSVGVILGLCVLVFRFRKRDSVLSCALILILVSPLAAYSVFPLADVVSEHRAYITLAGASLLIAVLLARAPQRQWLTGAVLALFLALTAARNTIWADEQRLWEDASRKAPAALRPHLNLGAIYQTRGMPDRAISEYEFVLARVPLHDAALANLGSLYLEQGQLDLAESLLDRAASRKSMFPAVYLNLGVVRLRQQRYAEARTLLEHARKLDPRQFMIGLNLGDIAFNERRPADAIAEYLAELQINPGSIITRFHLAKTYHLTGAVREAIDQYRIVLAANPGNAEVIEALRQLDAVAKP